MSNKSTPADRRKVGEILAAMAAELGTTAIQVNYSAEPLDFTIEVFAEGGWFEAFDATLDEAFIKALHYAAGTEPPPF
jgi:hypothetical protein